MTALGLNSAARRPRRTSWQVQRGVLFALLLREMKARVGGQWVGAVWTLFEPLAHVLMMVTVMGFIRNAAMPGIEYPVFLVTGLLPFFLFQHLSMRVMDGIEANRGLFAYRQVKPLDPLLTRAMVETMMNLFVTLFTLGLLAWLGFHVLPQQPLELLGVYALLIAFATGYGIFCAVLSHERQRLRSFLRMLQMPLYFLTGVIFPLDYLPREYIEWLLWNPLLHLVELSRHAFIPAYVPVRGVNVVYPLLCALVALAAGLALYRTKRQRLIST